MGNTLCKERGDNRSRSPKSPVDRVLSRCAQICPNISGDKPQTYWHKHVFETSPPTKMQSQKMNINDGWHNTTLKVSNNSLVSNDPNYPIAPPRRKRSSLALSTIIVPDENKPGGFKEVFGDLTKHPHHHHSDSDLSMNGNSFSNATNDFTDFSKDLSNDSTSTMNSNDARSLKRRISKVGNKKSDKFFGENLSDCLSDEPIVNDSPILSKKLDDKFVLSSGYESQSSDALDEFVQQNVDHRNVSLDDDKQVKHVEQRKVIKMNEQPPPPPPPPMPINVEVVQKNDTSPTSISNNDKRSSMDKRAEFLMTLLEGYNKDVDTTLATIDQNMDAIVVAPKRKQNKDTNGNGKGNPEEEVTLLSEIEKQIKTIGDSNGSSPSKTEKRVNFAFQEKIDNNSNSVDEVDFYTNMKPVDEPIIVPKRKIYKHICHDDDHIHDAINARKLESLDAEHIINNSPKKPARDFTKYGKSKTLPHGAMNNLYSDLPIEKPIRRNRKNISRDKLSTPTTVTPSIDKPPVNESPIENNGKPEDAIPNGIASESEKVTTSIPCEKTEKPIDTSSLRKCNSSQSFLTKDVMADIVNKVYDFDFDWNGYDDGSTQGLPVSKVSTRKISASRQEREKLQENVLNQNGFASTNPFKCIEPSLEPNDKQVSNDTSSVDEREHSIAAKEMEKLAEFSIGHTEITVSTPNLEKTKIILNDFLFAERKFTVETFAKIAMTELSEVLSSSDESIPSTIETVIMNPLKNSDSSVSGFGTTVKAFDAIEMSKNPSGNDVKWNDNVISSIDEQTKKRRSSAYVPPSKYEQKLTVPRRSLDSCDQKQLAKVFVVPEIKITTDADTSNAADHSVLLKYFNDSI